MAQLIPLRKRAPKQPQKDDAMAARIARELRISEVIGENLRKWRQTEGISYADIWERLKVSAIKFRSWETGEVSPRCPEFRAVVYKLGLEIVLEASLLTSDLMVQSQYLRRLLARGARWDRGRKPGEEALGAVRRVAA